MNQDLSATLSTEEQVQKLASFILVALKKGLVWRFEGLEEELCISKPEIISVFDMFQAAKIFLYSTIPWNPDEENYDIEPTQQMVDNRTGGFIIGVKLDDKGELSKLGDVNPHDPTKLKTLEGLRDSQAERIRFLKKHGKYLRLPTLSTDGERVVGELKFNLKSGNFIYRKTSGTLSPKTQEFKFLASLIKARGRTAPYADLMKNVFPGSNYTSKVKRRDLQTIAKNVKMKLEILPKRKSVNPELIKNVAGHGYRIIDANEG